MDEQDKHVMSLMMDFLCSFYEVFHLDWEHTRTSISEEFENNFNDRIYSTFLQPHIRDEHNNWENRGNLLSRYRKLRRELRRRGASFSWEDKIELVINKLD